MKRLTNMVLQYKIYPILMFICSILLAITVVIQNVSIAEILNRLLLKTNQDVVVIITITLFILLARATFNTLNQLMGDRLAQVVKYDLRQQLISKQSAAPIGAQLNTLTQNIDGITSFFNGYLPQVFKSMMIPIFIIVAMCFIHLNTALIMIVTAPFIPLFYIIFGLKTRDESKDKMMYLNQFSQQFLNKVKGLITLKLFNKTSVTERELYNESTTFRDLTMKILKSAFLSGLMLEFISMLGIGLVALEAGLGLILFHNIDFKTAAIAIILAPEFYNAIKDLGQSFHTGKQSEGASDAVFELLDQSTVPEKRQYNVNINQIPLVQLRNVTYRYKDATQNALNNINLDINEGDNIALVGSSGAGKSTLAQVIAQRFRPIEGSVSFKYKDLKIGFLSQSPYIFSSTIKENIAMFDDVPDEIIIKVLDDVGLKQQVLALNNGIHAMIGEGGEMLSGGQMRRIELARILLLRPDLLIFDEPATGLDVKTEHIIQDVLLTSFRKTTMITIAHRAHTIKNANKCIEMNNGCVQSQRTTQPVQSYKDGERR
ncbi:ABC transporter ATP-binding protein/permease [Staphylococcus gallinarum]|uniref:ABC transporter ATP-binding protein/permease n=1 Tax=Staphylococcus gallinarum TaxID=1293 RepID=UPI001E4F4C48|nr:ABC transporter ATP-binding protein/permease [Staphylococcus gallinarum]MCD8829586.1 ABC transporter ATP-binding protein/permease [Staphylococcus gallinarum]MDN6413311.1 ABC transporter ATP-binding protein/permease [Staphylococcus gallinarum]MEB6054301.1 ABC transporter ATP-binding protein/permease [Staphylococcus gallinarum]